jgi:hypothetical protein
MTCAGFVRRVMGTTVGKKIELKVHFAHDEDADVWYIAASDIPGLRLEAATPQELMERVVQCAPEMIELNLAEIVNKRVSRRKPTVSVTPIFDSPLELAHAM